jgi:hypothetical protein
MNAPMADNRQQQYPLSCPVCTVAMIGEKSDPEREDFDIHRCLNCGAVIDESRKIAGDGAAEDIE